jgi:hypothetical protein
MSKQTSLEAQIAAAINNTNCNAATLAALRREGEIAVNYAEQKLAEIRTDVFDPEKYHDPKVARQLLEDTEFELGRLQTLMPRLIQRLAVVEAAERHDQWLADYQALKPERDAIAAELKEAWAAHRMAMALAACEACKVKISELHQRRPAGEKLHLDEPELIARDLTEFSRAKPSLADMELFDLNGQRLWPPRQSIACALLPPAAYGFNDPYSGTNEWWRKNQAVQEERKKQEEMQLAKDATEREIFWGRRGP